VFLSFPLTFSPKFSSSFFSLPQSTAKTLNEEVQPPRRRRCRIGHRRLPFFLLLSSGLENISPLSMLEMKIITF